MMCFGKSKRSMFRSSAQEERQNEEIDKMIRRDKKALAHQVKILLLGAGESGKSTILKQMRIIHTGGFQLDERKEARQVIFSNLVVAYKIIIEEMKDMGVEFENRQSEMFEDIILAAKDIDINDPFPRDCLPAMIALWADGAVQQTIKRGNEYALHDNLKYYYNHLNRLFAKNYIPNDQDVLRSRLRTTGITETVFDLGPLTYHMFDVGGQRSERKKWVHCFEDVHCLLFVAAISGYDQCLVEDKTANQMQEALILFESIIALSWFRRSSIILFLNKIDLFREKLADQPIRDYFPDYEASNEDFDAATEYFAAKFRRLNRAERREVYVHFTNATDTNLLKITMKSVQDTIIQQNLNSLMMY
ncbi:MAG: Guanine nucleotide-binding alpha-2 subunit [Lasallia pustulata]|uniref:Guanine nucleotide-binding alpha-2 subunit n=2 Tax=Lasallia pustulata TaxID=136370 RepID=A0A5M8PD86_9LECA|nr:MAG: Guanine nucleotide-binding alpha-2 subunit [Lasallia pustulata]